MADSPNSQAIEFADGAEKSVIATVLAACDDQESRFVTRLLEGQTADDAARGAGYSGRAVGARVLGRPQVRAALTQIAPYLEPRQGMKLAAPYVLERVVQVALHGSDAQAIHAARDVLNLAGLGPVSRSETIHASLSSVLDALDRRRVAEGSAQVDVTPRLP